MSIKSRRATLEDIGLLKEFEADFISAERPFDTDIPPKGQVQYFNFSEILQDPNSHLILIEKDEEVIGCGCAIIKNNIEWALNPKYGLIRFIYVKPEFRRQKVSKYILETLISWLQSKKIQDIRLRVYAENHGAVKAYEKYGFKDFLKTMQYTPDPKKFSNNSRNNLNP